MDKFYIYKKNLITYESDDPIIEIPEGITDIAGDCFNSVYLEKVVFPHSLKRIREYAFYSCDGETEYYYNGTKEEWYKVIKQFNWNNNINDYCIHCIDGALTEEVFVYRGVLFDYQGDGTNVCIPKKVKKIIGDIYDFEFWKEITYEGPKEEWMKIKKDIDAFSHVLIHCSDGDIKPEKN